MMSWMYGMRGGRVWSGVVHTDGCVCRVGCVRWLVDFGRVGCASWLCSVVMRWRPVS
jgi:hypothetical protein